MGFVVGGTIVQGALLAGITGGIALAADLEGGFFDRPADRAGRTA